MVSGQVSRPAGLEHLLYASQRATSMVGGREIDSTGFPGPQLSPVHFFTSRQLTSLTWARTKSRTSASPSSAQTMALLPALSQLPAQAGSSAQHWRLTSLSASPTHQKRTLWSPSSISRKTSSTAQTYLSPLPGHQWLQELPLHLGHIWVLRSNLCRADLGKEAQKPWWQDSSHRLSADPVSTLLPEWSSKVQTESWQPLAQSPSLLPVSPGWNPDYL
jgi:hypothetical protein